MRLVCPNCEAKYEVPDDAIPDTGRDVQCASCGHGWFQMRNRATPAPALPVAAEKPPAKAVSASASLAAALAPDVAEDAAPLAAGPVVPGTERLDPAVPVHDEKVLTILREEAEREAKARREKTRPLGYQSDLGVDQALDARSKPAKAAKAADPQVQPKPQPEPVAEPKPQPKPVMEPEIELKVAARRDLLPDVEEIKSTLQPSDMPEPEFASGAYGDGDAQEERGAFRAGFLLVIALAILGASVYSSAPWLATRFPTASGPLSAYVAGVDTLRLQLDGLMRTATQLIAGDKG